MRVKLFNPGPVEVRQELLNAQAQPMIGHRGSDYSDLHKSIVEKMKRLFGVNTHEVFIFASSASGVMEGAIRNCVSASVLHTINGAFSERWHAMSVANGKDVDALEVEWGRAITPDMLRRAVAEKKYDAVTITHNETSTGIMHKLPELIEVIKEDPERLVFVDAVSSAGGAVIRPEEIGIDVLIFGTQKCFALPPGLACAIVSPHAMERAANTRHRGYYFDFLEMKKYNDKWQTPATPAISLMYALDRQLARMNEEGMEKRAARHAAMANLAHAWCGEHGFELLPEKGYESTTMTAARNGRNIDITSFRNALKERGYVIADGYGKMKGQGFRIGHMGDWKEEDLEELLKTMTVVLHESV